MFLGSKLRPVCTAYLDNVGSSTSHDPIGLRGDSYLCEPLDGIMFHLVLLFMRGDLFMICQQWATVITVGHSYQLH
jgi:hypothetical protein